MTEVHSTTSFKPQTPISMPKPKPAEPVEDLFGFNFTAAAPPPVFKAQQPQPQPQPQQKLEPFAQPFADFGINGSSNQSSAKPNTHNFAAATN